MKSLSCVQLIATPWTAAHQAPQSMEVSRQEYWSGVPLPSLISPKGTKKERTVASLGILALSLSYLMCFYDSEPLVIP